ncbi:16S rRNA (guanine(966)-N(2))-methyltransferase RsmD [Rhabdaerophilum calidifontis]|uniref:16S rRNA (guanine(966)-N(2))-methyltransferase RsmD n=1 Tax=Rhabdaerophilum calidifontis TaxID=2604328 RepID=UPI00123BEB91|nr:16S rRNA (guanine(966)-N(2))-methyltransferase RsmD [Rhabdaerophilum calidifontis]
MRIVGGRLGGRVLRAPASMAIRPTTDRMRESLFNILEHGFEEALAGARVLDLFAGTGALSCEALSRGAGFAVMVDIGAEARGLQRENVEALGLGGVTRILRRDATRLGDVAPFTPFTLVFCDPPYGRGLGEAALRAALQGGWLAPGAIAVLEERAGTDIALPAPLAEIDRRRAGDTQLLFARMPG